MPNTNDKIVKYKVGWLNLADKLANTSKACKMMGVSRDTFYRYKEVVDDSGVESLLDQNRCVPNVKNRVDPVVESAVLEYAIDRPAHGQVRVSNELCKQNVFVSPDGVGSVWLRHDFTESQIQALERKKHDDQV